MVIKCKMCGGDLVFTPGDTYGTCEFCSSVNTIPQGDDEQKLNLYNRANHFRRQGEFDKALAAYERLLEQDDTDAEAHWGAALSRYGIEYVEDPATKKRLPTCHRLQVTSILADEDYKAAIEHAPDSSTRRVYEDEAARIAEIQKDILAISRNEKPYDVFICYKETDERGQRTRDSQWAQEVYYGLTEQGYKVFFSRITLEDKLGQEYEPYIFAALNSARVMLVIGSKPEYFNAVWVKNEWSRYLSLMAEDRKRLLIPCYRDMDPYDLPDELSSLQSQDMSKIGFMQDLLRGVRKVLDAEKKAEPVKAAPAPVTVVQEAPVRGSVENLMKRVRLFLEDGDYHQAGEYLDKVLDQDAEYAPAYAAKVCVTLHLSKESDLAEASPEYENDPDWKKALRFADAQQKPVYEGYIENARQKATYRQTLQQLEYAHTSVNKLNELADTFDSIKDYKNAKALAVKCRQEAAELAEKNRKAAEAQRAALYEKATALISEAGRKSSSWNAVRLLLADPTLNGFRDVEALRSKAAERYQECKAAEDEAARRAAEKRREAEAAAEAKKKRMTLIGIGVAVVLVAVLLLVTQVIIPGNNYRNAVALQQAGKYEEAIAAFTALGNYSDAKAKITACQYDAAASMQQAGKYEEAIAAFTALGDYRDSSAKIVECQNGIKEREYQAAIALQQAGKYEEAIVAFTALGSYNDSAMQIRETKYLQAKALLTAGNYTKAYSAFVDIKGYKDVDNLLKNDQNLVAAAAKLKLYKTVGSYVTLGTYPQTSGGTDQTAIEWQVLEYDAANERSLLISRYGLVAKPYNTKRVDITWEKCTLRAWLNSDFMNKAFSSAEQSAILTTAVDNSKSQGYSGWSTNGGNNTQDKVFLLSNAEANKYLGVTYDDSSNTKSRVAPTAYATKQGASTSNSSKTADGQAAGWWWLRSPGYAQDRAASVSRDGSLGFNSINYDLGCVRPALWINLKSDIF